MRISQFARLRFAHLPTPLEPMRRLSQELGGPSLYVKRDDCTGLAGGGNKARKLEFLMADAVAGPTDVILTHGAIQSNHVRQTAAIAAKLGLHCEALLEERTDNVSPDYRESGNVLLDRLFDARLTIVPRGTDMNAALDNLADKVRRRGGRPYIIPGGGSNPLGALGYAECALELVSQAKATQLRIDYIVHSTGSAGTQAGLVAGLRSCGSSIGVIGISVRAPREQQETAVGRLASHVDKLLGTTPRAHARDVVAYDQYVGAGYGVATDAVLKVIALMARTEGILLDPIYTGKAMAGLVELIRDGRFSKTDNVVFLHTGGSAGLFGYVPEFLKHLVPNRS